MTHYMSIGLLCSIGDLFINYKRHYTLGIRLNPMLGRQAYNITVELESYCFNCQLEVFVEQIQLILVAVTRLVGSTLSV